ncbi:MAG: DUF4325 domain-containing protein [Bacteroidales bacterium]|nr:DUF4325 domain-containing protein [Bacteroidales bacterium]
MTTILITDFVTLNQGVTPDEGTPIYERIVESLNQGECVCLDFTGITLMTTAFLNVVIGTLYKDYKSEQLKDLLSFKGLNDDIAIRIKKVTDTAKLFYADTQKFESEIDEIING